MLPIVIGTTLGLGLLGVSVLTRPRTSASFATHGPRPIFSLPPLPPRRVAQGTPEQAQALLRDGDRARDEKRFALARSNYFQSMQIDPECDACVLRLVRVEEKIVLEIDGAFLAGEQHLQAGRFDDAVRSFNYVRELDPDPASPYFIHAGRLLEQTNAARAQALER